MGRGDNLLMRFSTLYSSKMEISKPGVFWCFLISSPFTMIKYPMSRMF